MGFLETFMYVLVVLLMGFSRSEGWSSGGTVAKKYQTIVVDQSGNGNYTTILAAIDAIPSDNMEWICVYVKTGTYK